MQRGNVILNNLQVLNAILYVAEQGCKWRGLPTRIARNTGALAKTFKPPVEATPVSVGQRSPREIPSFFIMAFKVVRGTPSRPAVSLTTPPVSRNTRRI